MLEQAPDLDFAQSEAEAINRANWFKRFDPFPKVPPALLSSAEIEDYIRVTAMLFPYRPDDRALKPASYEVRPGHKFVWWREERLMPLSQVGPYVVFWPRACATGGREGAGNGEGTNSN